MGNKAKQSPRFSHQGAKFELKLFCEVSPQVGFFSLIYTIFFSYFSLSATLKKIQWWGRNIVSPQSTKQMRFSKAITSHILEFLGNKSTIMR